MIPLAALCMALVALIVFLLRHQNEERAEWARERQLLITRIQHPEFVVAPPAEVRPDEDLLTSEPDEIDFVGTVVNG